MLERSDAKSQLIYITSSSIGLYSTEVGLQFGQNCGFKFQAENCTK